jgi:membrane protein
MAIQSAQVRNEILPLVKQTVADFQRHRAQWLAAAIAYFTMFAIAPLIIVVVEIAGAIFGQNRAVLDEMYGYVAQSAGTQAASALQSLVASSSAEQHSGALAQYAAWGAFLLAALGLVGSIQQALNTVWEAAQPRQGILGIVWGYVTSFIVVLAIALLLLVSLLITAALTFTTTELALLWPFFPALSCVGDFLISVAIITVLFALLFNYLPHRRTPWRDLWPGAAVTALLFVCGQFLLGWYLGSIGVSSTYGAFGSLVVLLLWVNYSAQIVLLGAEFTHVYARRSERHTPQTVRDEIDTSQLQSVGGSNVK